MIRECPRGAQRTFSKVKPTVERILASAAALKPFPKVAQRALALLDDPLVSATKLVDVIALDAALTVAVLKVANSASFARTRQVADLKQALALLGNARFRELVFASAAVPFLSAAHAGYQLSAGELWRHSVATALLAQQLAKQAGLPEAGSMLFTAGLLHDLGKSILSQYVQSERSPRVLYSAAMIRCGMCSGGTCFSTPPSSKATFGIP